MAFAIFDYQGTFLRFQDAAEPIAEGEQAAPYVHGVAEPVELHAPDGGGVTFTRFILDEVALQEWQDERLADRIAALERWTKDEARTAIDGLMADYPDKATWNAWVDANVTTLAQARGAIKQLGRDLIEIRGVLKKDALLTIRLRDLMLDDYKG